jgi:anti-sigma regulatory factor (Ser/Thr protein kinase)
MAYQRSQAGDACVAGSPRAEGHHATSAVALERVWAEANWSARAALGPHGQISAYHHRGVWLIEVDGDYSDIAQEVDHSIQLSLAESPRGVVVSMLHTPGEAENGSLLDSLASAGRHVRRWPGASIVIVCRDSHTLAALNSRPEGRYLGHSSSLLRAWSQILTHDPSPTAHLRLPSDALAARTARRFLSQTCLDWDMSEHLVAGPIIVSELVTNAVEHASGDIDVFLAENARSLRVAVRDRNAAPPVTPPLDVESLRGRGLQIVQALSQSTGALPAAGGGKLIWAVLGPDAGSASGAGGLVAPA